MHTSVIVGIVMGIVVVTMIIVVLVYYGSSSSIGKYKLYVPSSGKLKGEGVDVLLSGSDESRSLQVSNVAWALGDQYPILQAVSLGDILDWDRLSQLQEFVLIVPSGVLFTTRVLDMGARFIDPKNRFVLPADSTTPYLVSRKVLQNYLATLLIDEVGVPVKASEATNLVDFMLEQRVGSTSHRSALTEVIDNVGSLTQLQQRDYAYCHSLEHMQELVRILLKS